MESEFKSSCTELKLVRTEKDRAIAGLSAQINDKQEEIETLQEKLLFKEGLETKCEELKKKNEIAKETIG